ncbi:MAG TPA: alpha/beta fold hydrolase [Steroidobacteraceae bacterium]|nr:alpha/beta fold hydrolase [Steroidobacteraceae bacterium]
MRTLTDKARADRPAPTRIVLLPGAFSAPEDFVREGFVAALRARALDIDLTLASMDFGHVTDRSVLDEVQRELIAPAQAAGCALWLGGISLGGYVALACAARARGELAGLCLFAPYLGSYIVTSEVERAGLARWDPGALPEDDDERRVWRFIQTLRGGTLPVHLGLGRDDRFGVRHRLLADALRSQDVDRVPGGHDWPTWRQLWENFLDARFRTPA